MCIISTATVSCLHPPSPSSKEGTQSVLVDGVGFFSFLYTFHGHHNKLELHVKTINVMLSDYINSFLVFFFSESENSLSIVD